MASYITHMSNTRQSSQAATGWCLQSDMLEGRHKQLVHMEGVTLRWKESFSLSFHPPSSSYPPSAKPNRPSPAFNILLTRLFYLSVCAEREVSGSWESHYISSTLHNNLKALILIHCVEICFFSLPPFPVKSEIQYSSRYLFFFCCCS